MIYTGTTPTIELNFSEDVDLSLGSSFAVTFSYPVSEKVILEKTEEDLEIGEHTVGVFLTQEETLKFPKGSVMVQLNWLYQDGTKTRRACSVKKAIYWDSNLKKEVME